jgi:hypothetical protein
VRVNNHQVRTFQRLPDSLACFLFGPKVHLNNSVTAKEDIKTNPPTMHQYLSEHSVIYQIGSGEVVLNLSLEYIIFGNSGLRFVQPKRCVLYWRSLTRERFVGNNWLGYLFSIGNCINILTSMLGLKRKFASVCLRLGDVLMVLHVGALIRLVEELLARIWHHWANVLGYSSNNSCSLGLKTWFAVYNVNI